MLWVLLLPLLPAVLAVDWTQRCTQVSSITGHLQYVDRATYEIVMSTVINTNIALGETLCFKVDRALAANTNDTLLKSLLQGEMNIIYALHLSKVEQTHNVHNSYKLAIPKTSRRQCSCDCPCFTNHKLNQQNFCDKQPEPCVQIYRNDQTTKNCNLAALCASSHSTALCSFSVERDTSFSIYDGLEISSAETWAHFELSAYSSTTGQAIGTARRLIYNLNEGSQIFAKHTNGINGKMSVTSTGIPGIIPAGWYFKKSSASDLYTGIEVNSLNEWSLDKLGWLRWDGSRIQFPAALKPEIQSRFSYAYTSCARNQYTWQFTGRYTNKEFRAATKSLVKDKYSSRIESLVTDSRRIAATLKTSPRLNVILEFKESADIVFYFDASHIENFTVQLQTDKFSNSFLNFSLVGAAGSLVGFVQHETLHTDFPFSLYVDSMKPVNYIAYATLPDFIKCNESIKYNICLRAFDEEGFICTIAMATCEDLTDFVIPEMNITDDSGATQEQLGFGDKVKLFFQHLNPVTWVKGLAEKTGYGWLGMITDFIVLLVILVFARKIKKRCCPNVGCCCWCKLCCFIKKKNKKMLEEDVTPLQNGLIYSKLQDETKL